MRLATGTRLDGYELIRALGSGGMGDVWLATELHLERRVALKLLPFELTRDPARVARFHQEARAASALNHPNVCVIHALGTTSDGQHYIAMEHVDGRTLRARLSDGCLTTSETVDIAAQIASALATAHASGVVHRDIKPENVMLRRDGIVKVLDFGLAKLRPQIADGEVGPTRTAFNTEAGTIVGTVEYMSPEQARGEPVDERTDIWAVGALLYEMVTGRSPFAARSTSEVLAGILQSNAAPLARFEPGAPAELQRIVTKALRKDREQRYQTARDLLLDLQTLLDELRTTPASERSVAVPALRPRRRAVLLAILLTAIAASAWWWRSTGGSNQVNPPARAAPVQRTLTGLTFGPGLQSNPTWSPDGQSVAYASNAAGQFDIWVQTIRGGEPRQLTRSPADDTQPSWSPTGDRIVFRSEREGGGLFVVPATGGAERLIASFGMYPQWADGSDVLFRSGPLASTGLNLVPAGGDRPPRQILESFMEQGSWAWISGHPDGRLSAVGLHRQLGHGFFTVTRDGEQLTRAQVPSGFPLPLGSAQLSGQGTRVERFQWDSTGRALYIEAVVNEVRNIWRVDVEPKTLAWRSAEQLTRGAGADAGAALSPDGKRLVYTTERRTARLWVFPLDGAGRRLVGEGIPITPADATIGWSDLSPDSQKVAYVMRRPGSRGVDLWTVDVDGGHRELLAQNVVGATWSRDGTAIGYTLFRDEPEPGQWALAARSLSGPERLLSTWDHQSALLPFDWTPDGKAIVGSYYAPIAAVPKLVLWSTAKPSAKPERILLAQTGVGFWQSRFSPNGRWLCFVLGRQASPDGVELMVAPSSGGPPSQWTRIAADHVWPDKPRWASDGRTLYFLSRHHTGRFDLWGVGFDPDRGRSVGPPFRVTDFSSAGHMISSDIGGIEMGIAAGRVLLTMASVTGNLWILDNVDK